MNWWNKLSLNQKLYSVVTTIILLICFELFICLFVLDTLVSVRAFIGGEGTWAKAQKNAIISLHMYTTTTDEKYYEQFHEHIQIIMGDYSARLELEKEKKEYAKIYAGFSVGKIHSDDIPLMVSFVDNFRQVSFLQEVFQIWGRGDEVIFDLVKLAEVIHEKVINKEKITNNELNENIKLIEFYNRQLTDYESQFSEKLALAARKIQLFIKALLIVAVAVVGLLVLFLSFIFSSRISSAIEEFSSVAKRVGNGDFRVSLDDKYKVDFEELAEAFNTMIVNLKKIIEEKEFAEHSNQVKNLFMANMSHEIRNPLNSILGFSELIRDPNITDKEKNQYLDIVKKTGVVLTTIINDILDISKIETDKVTLEMKTFSLTELLNEVKLILDVRCQEKGIDLKISKQGIVSDLIYTDPVRLKQILINIVGNAIKFTDKGYVEVIYCVDSYNLNFIIKDTGIGLTEDEKDKLFYPFSQGDVSIRKKYGGSGLGLFLSKKLAQLLGGNIYLKSSIPGVGSEFVVTIDYDFKVNQLAESQKLIHPSERTKKHAKGDLDKLKVLIVEDSLENQLLLQTYLQRKNIKTLVASNGLEAIEIYLRDSVDIILMDMQMPVMDGYTATQEFRKLGCHLPIIAITGYAMKEDNKKCLDSGCDAYLSKPIESQTLIDTIMSFL
jgi:signal transduction histidine kinase/CheY-like chemotaxis protein